jgi:hypothetical protein
MVKASKFFDNIFEDKPCPSEPVSLKDLNLNKDVLLKVVEYSNYAYIHKAPHIRKPIYHENLLDITSPWYASYANQFSEDQLCEMILAANVL